MARTAARSSRTAPNSGQAPNTGHVSSRAAPNSGQAPNTGHATSGAASGAASGAPSRIVPSESLFPSGPGQSVSARSSPNSASPNSAHAAYDCSENPLQTYCPEGGFTDDNSIRAAIDLLEDTPANKYLSDSKMAKHTDTDMLMSMHFQRLKVFQLVVTLINAAQAIVGQSVAITKVKENYKGMMKRSLKALFILQGGTMDLGNNASRESRHQELKHCKIVEVPNNVNKNSIINLNNPKVKAWDIGSIELDLDAYHTRTRDVSLLRIASSSPILTRVS